MGDLVFLDDLDNRTLIVLEIYIPVPVGEQRRHLGFLGKQIRLRHRFFNDLHDPGQQVLDDRNAILIGLHLCNRVAVRPFHEVDCPENRLPRVRVIFMDIQIGALVIGQGDCAGLTGEQFHMVLRIIGDMVQN